MSHKKILIILSLFSIAMANLEAAVVVYMRYLYYPENPQEIFPLQFLNSYDTVLELGREAATVIMILTVAMLTERTSRTRTFAAFVFVFGVWDLFYYFWLKVLLGWPTSWLEWDVLFLIPTIWLGPWICPALISVLFIAWGSSTIVSTVNVSFSSRSIAVFLTGACLGLVAFLQPGLEVVINEGAEALSGYEPGKFWWWLFAISYVVMATGMAMTLFAPAKPASSQL